MLIPWGNCELALSSFKSYPLCTLVLDFVEDTINRLEGRGGGDTGGLTWGRNGPPSPISASSSSSNGELAKGSGVGARPCSVSIGGCNRCCLTGAAPAAPGVTEEILPAAGSWEGET